MYFRGSGIMATGTDVSVIIPTFNRRERVQTAIRSVLCQTHPAAEIIVVDDGSSDGTAEALADRFGSKIRLERKTNGGVSSARNLGLRLARGCYFAFIDSDDEWLPDKLKLQMEWLASNRDFGMVLCDVIRTDITGRVIDVLKRREQIPEDGLVLKWLLMKPAWVPSSAMIRREVYDQVGEFDESLITGEDLDFHLRVARHWKIGVISQPLVRAIRGHDGLSSMRRTLDDYLLVMQRGSCGARGVVPESDRLQAMARAYDMVARERVHLMEWSKAWDMCRRATESDPQRGFGSRVTALAPLIVRRLLIEIRNRGRNFLSDK